ncbi:MAG: DNA polymerase I [Gemmatimonadota bacterium]|nr:DNA polymerase I [Gemmatimonadota bacterium]
MIPDSNGRPRLYLIDGYALIYRAFFALISRPLISSRGENTSAAWGVTRFLLKILEQHQPEYLGVVFDAGNSERNILYPEYKATRDKMPDDLEASLPRIYDLVRAFNVPVLRLEGFEADDVIGTLAKQANAAGLETVIVSGDKDFYQLIEPGVVLLNPGRGGPTAVEEEWVDLTNAHERLGVAPHHVTDYLGLIGDSSDNVPGVKGIGPKTAISLIEQYGSVEEILRRVPEITNKRARESLEAFAENARLSKTLVTIRTDLPMELDLDDLRCGAPDREALKRIFLELEFHTLVREYGAPEPVAAAEAQPTSYRTLVEPAEVEALVRRLRELGSFSVDTETTSIDPVRADLISIAISPEPGEAFYLPFAHRAPVADLLDTPPPVQNLPPLLSPAMAPLVELLRDPGVRKTGQNLKYDFLVFRRAGVEMRGITFDTMVASYLLDPNRREHGLDSLALQHLDYRTTTYEEVVGKGKTELLFAEVEIDRARDYACEDTDITLRLARLFAPELERLELVPLFESVEVPLIEVLADMEWEGIRVDAAFFAKLERRLADELAVLQTEIHKEAGLEFNIGSTHQLREVLFERLKLPVIKKTKTGASTDVSVLEELAAMGHRLPTLLMEYRQLDKLLSTYVTALPRAINPATGRVHTSFNQTVASTGRLASSDPNLQNIPIRTDLGAEIRRGFIPRDGCIFLSADYSQIELRVLAHCSNDPTFVEAFRSEADIHRETAALVFGVDPADVTRAMRDRAKTVNFAVIYGVGSFSLGRQLGVSNSEAKEFIDRYFERFPGVRAYLDSQVELARQRGYVETLTGRRRYIPEISSKNFNIRSFGERVATNAPIQGTAADLIKIAMIDIHRTLKQSGSGARMLLQVHDELLFEAPYGEVEATLELVRERMEHAMELRVPLRVETGTGGSWRECK